MSTIPQCTFCASWRHDLQVHFFFLFSFEFFHILIFPIMIPLSIMILHFLTYVQTRLKPSNLWIVAKQYLHVYTGLIVMFPFCVFYTKKKKEDLTNILRNREIFCAIRIVTSRVWQDSENVLTWQWLGWPNSNLQVLVSRRNFMLNQIKLKLQLIPIPCKEKKT